jgi:DNA gyrase subunit B
VSSKQEQLYDADALQKLDPIDHIRHRISMYLGDNTGPGGLSTALREILDNSQDEFLNGHGKLITLTFFPDGSAEVQDSGRGIPTGINKSTGLNGIVLSLGHVGAGGKFGTDIGGYGGGSGGLNGVGTTASNAVSRRFDVTVYQNNKEHKISFCKGKPGRFSKENDPDAAFTPNGDLIVSPDKRPAAVKKARPTGTTIRMYPDQDIFIPGAAFDVETIKFRLKSTAFLLPGLTIEINDLRDPDNELREVYAFDGGIAEMLETIAPDKTLHAPIHFTTVRSFTEMATVASKTGAMSTEEVERKVDIDVAFQYGEGYATTTSTFVNIIHTKHGGTHENGFYRGMSRVLVENIKNTRGLLKAKEDAPTIEDVKEGLTAIVSIKFPSPQFVGQEKATLGTSAITSLMSQAVVDELKVFLDNKKNAATAKMIYQKIVNAMRVRTLQRQQKETARRKTALESSSMPAKLLDCAVNDTVMSEIQLCEGDSALGGLRLSRDARYQAIYPLRGKPLNVHKASVADMLKNEEMAAIIQIIGAGVGANFDVEAMRYGRVLMYVDADVDGSHIRALLICFFWKYMRPLIEAGRLYAPVPPLFSVVISSRKGERLYATTQEDLDQILMKLKKEGKKYEKIQRHKGLGEYDPEILWETTLNPETRTLRQITIEDAVESERIIDLAMGTNVENRKNWIIDRRRLLSDEEIDA